MRTASASPLRRLLVVGTALLLLGLLAIVGFALFNTQSARQTVDRARGLLHANKPGEAVELLLLARRSVGQSGDHKLRREILQLSAEAHERVNNLKRALQDVDDLLAGDPGSVDLGLQRIRLLCAMRAPEAYDEALTTSLKLAEANPASPWVLAVCGETRQTIYRHEITQLLEGHLAALPSDVLRQVTALLPTFLYRAPDDPEGARNEAVFQQVLAVHLPDVQQRDSIRRKLEHIRQQIARAVADYRRALMGDGESLSGLRGVSFALIQQGRLDDAALLCEVFCRRFATGASAIAAERAVAIHRARGHLGEAERAARAWMRGRTPLQQYHALALGNHWGAIDQAVDVWVVMARARLAAGDTKGVAALTAGVEELARALHGEHAWAREDRMPPRYRYLLAIHAIANQSWEEATRLLTALTKVSQDWHDGAGADLLPEVLDLRWTAVSKTGNSQRLEEVAQDWIQLRPNDAIPLVRQAEVLAKIPELEAARQVTRRALALDPTADESLALLVQLADKVESKEGRGIEGIYHRSLATASGLVSNLQERAIYLGVADKALKALRSGTLPPELVERVRHVAWRNAQEAVHAFPRAPLARRTLIETCFASGNERQARAEVEALQGLRAATVADLEFLRDARTRLGDSSDEQLRDLLARSPGVLALGAPLMERCLDRGGFEDATRIGRRFLKERGQDPEVMVLLGRAELQGNRRQLAREVLLAVPDASPWRVPALELLADIAAEAGDLAAATSHAREMVRKCEISAASWEDSAERSGSRPAGAMTGERPVPGPREHAEILWRSTRGLAEHRAYEAAVVCCEALLDLSAHRTPELQTFAGRLHFRLGHEREARFLLEAAVAQKGAGEAKLLLATHYAVAGNMEDADEVFNLPDAEAREPADARIGLLIRLGRRKPALQAIQQVLRQEPLNYAYLALEGLARASQLGPPPAPPGPVPARPDDKRGAAAPLPPRVGAVVPDIEALVLQSPKALLDLLTLGGLDGFDARIVAASKELQALHPTNPWVLQFSARALAAIGQWQNAIGELGNLIARFEGFYPAYDALCDILARQGNSQVPVQELVANYVKATSRNSFPFSPRMLALANQLSAAMSGASGNIAAADQLRRIAWLLDPSSYRLGRDLAMESAVKGQFAEAMNLLAKMPPGRIPAKERIAFFDLYFYTAARHLEQAQDPALRSRLRARAEEVLKSDGDIGSALHFLMDTDPGGEDAFPPARLVEHVLFLKNKGITPGRDLPAIVRSLRVLARREGRSKPLGLIQELLAADPTLFSLWVLRAELLLADQQPKQALTAIGWILDVIDFPQAALCMADIAAALGGLPEIRTRQVQEILTEATPSHQRALGLLDWRAGNHGEAARRLAGDAGGKDPVGLYVRATVGFALGTPEGVTQSAADLRTLGEKFPDSFPAANAALLLDQVQRIKL